MRGGKWILVVALAAGGAAGAQARTETPARAGNGAPSDAERAKSIEAQLHKDPVLSHDQLAVEVTGKHVRLSGVVDNEAERRRAEDIVRQSDPTLLIENLLQLPGDRQATPTTSEKIEAGGRQAAHKAAKAAGDVGAMLSDGWITSKVKAELMTTDGVHSNAIDVDTADHVVTLRGQVRSEAERRRALSVARHARGVNRVIDQLQLVPEGQ